VLGDTRPIRGIRDPTAEGGKIVLRLRILDVREQLTALPHQMQPTP
jgi:hypothetical protein